MHAIHRAAAAALLASCAVSATAHAQSPRPIWTTAPSAQAMDAAYPAAAKASKLGGRAVLSCAVTLDGALEACQAVAETPADQGFAAAALALAPAFRMKTELTDGTPSAGLHFNIPIRFVPPEEAAASSAPMRAPVFKPTTRTYADLGEAGPFYPERAARSGQNGVAVIQCRAAASGALTNCEVISVSPGGWSFEYAALAMAKQGWLTAAPRLENGQPVDGETVRIEAPFRMRRR